METSLRGTERIQSSHSRPQQQNTMSMIAMAAPSSHAPFSRGFWDGPATTTSTDYSSSSLSVKPRAENDRIALPSIRQAIPELQIRVVPQENVARTPISAISPATSVPGLVTPEYIHSPNSNKRRRLSADEEEREERQSRVPRLYNTSPRRTEIPAPRPASPRYAPRVVPKQWAPNARTSPRLPSGGLPSIRSPVERSDARPSLPSFPPAAHPPPPPHHAAPPAPMGYERGSAPMPRMRGHSNDEYAQEPPRPLYVHHPDARFEPSPYRPSGPYHYGYHHPSRMQSLSLGAIHAMDRSPFSAGVYGPPYGEYMRLGEMSVGMAGDSKQRKRRGNLPKETTDKLRAWFVAHLHHPYPTEDEKQELMRQTGLQLNQISNWFINARRRQLPTMISNARAESHAMSSRNTDGRVLNSTERGDGDAQSRRSPVTSEGGDSAFDDDMEARRRSAHMKRGGSY